MGLFEASFETEVCEGLRAICLGAVVIRRLLECTIAVMGQPHTDSPLGLAGGLRKPSLAKYICSTFLLESVK